MKIIFFSLLMLATSSMVWAQENDTQPETMSSDAALQRSVEELQTSIGLWNVVTEFLAADGSVSHTVEGSYEFSWVVPDRVITGISEIPELDQTSAILFYLHGAKSEIEMVSVGADGKLWVMTGPLGENYRSTPEFETADGGTAQLKFTRYNVTENEFESRMDYTSDGGQTWVQGNHQTFRRSSAGSS